MKGKMAFIDCAEIPTTLTRHGQNDKYKPTNVLYKWIYYEHIILFSGMNMIPCQTLLANDIHRFKLCLGHPK